MQKALSSLVLKPKMEVKNVTDCADMDCEDCINSKWATTPKTECPMYTINPQDRIRRKLLKASSGR